MGARDGDCIPAAFMETYGDVTTEPSQRRTAMQTSGVFRLFFVICLGTRGDYRSAEGVSTTWRTGAGVAPDVC